MRAAETDNLSGSLTDLMTSLMVIFVLLLVVTLNNSHQQTKGSRQRLIDQLEKQLGALSGERPNDQVHVEADPSDPLGVILVVPRQLLDFAFGQAIVPAGGQGFLADFIPRLNSVVCSPGFRGEIGSVTVEGHADPVGGDIYNLGLSQERALAVAKESLALLPQGAPRDCLERFLLVGGRGFGETIGQTRPSLARAEERRVQFEIRLQSAEERAAHAGMGAP